MVLDLTSLEKALSSLKDSLETFHRISEDASLKSDKKLINSVKSGVIQNFEVAYEMAWKLMKRWIETQISRENVDGVPRRELFRLSAESSLIDDVDLWMSFHFARNESAHTYNLKTAEEVYVVTPIFLQHANKLLANLKSKNDLS